MHHSLYRISLQEPEQVLPAEPESEAEPEPEAEPGPEAEPEPVAVQESVEHDILQPVMV